MQIRRKSASPVARFVCLFLMPPFLVVCSFALVGMSFLQGVLSDCLDGALEFAGPFGDDLFWLIGLYFSFAILVAAGSWILEGIRWVRIHGRNQSPETPT
jgi:hypothetical protein